MKSNICGGYSGKVGLKDGADVGVDDDGADVGVDDDGADDGYEEGAIDVG